METHEGTTGVAEASAQLAALQADREAVAARAMQPWWYDAALGVLVFAVVAQFSLDSDVVSVIVPLVVVAGCFALTQVYRRMTGFFVSGFRSGRPRRAMWAWSVGYAVVAGAGIVAEEEFGLRGAMVAAGVVLGIGIALLSRWWTRLYIAELRDAR
jgi:hypothetical protein